MWSTEHRQRTSASPTAVMAVWHDVAGWPRWDASLVATTLDGPFTVGATGTLHPVGMPAPLPFTLTSVDTDGFCDETALDGLVLRFVHRVEPDGDGALVTVRVDADGPDEEQVGPAVAEDLPESLVALAAEAERRAALG